MSPMATTSLRASKLEAEGHRKGDTDKSVSGGILGSSFAHHKTFPGPSSLSSWTSSKSDDKSSPTKPPPTIPMADHHVALPSFCTWLPGVASVPPLYLQNAALRVMFIQVYKCCRKTGRQLWSHSLVSTLHMFSYCCALPVSPWTCLSITSLFSSFKCYFLTHITLRTPVLSVSPLCSIKVLIYFSNHRYFIFSLDSKFPRNKVSKYHPGFT